MSDGAGAYWVSTTVALVVLCAVAVWLLRVLQRRAAPLRGLRVLARLPLVGRQVSMQRRSNHD